LAAGQVDSITFVGIYTIIQADANNGEVTNQATVSGTSPLGLIVNDLSDDTSVDADGPTVVSIKNCVIVVSNALTPNGDGKNDYFHIEGLDCFSNNTVEIYNRWGVLVFETNKYNNVDNVFEGFSRGRTTIRQSEGLPDGTYYYVVKYLDFNGNGMQKAGYLYLTR
jgi:gliding motility-associated-like protein